MLRKIYNCNKFLLKRGAKIILPKQLICDYYEYQLKKIQNLQKVKIKLLFQDIIHLSDQNTKQGSQMIIENIPLKDKIKSSIHNLSKMSEQKIQIAMNKGFRSLNTLNVTDSKAILLKSIEQLIEGRRDVVRDLQYKMEDGETVEQKVKRVENKLKFLIQKTDNSFLKDENQQYNQK